MWCTTTGYGYPMEKNPNKIMMFVRFVESGLSLPASDFFRGIMQYYGIDYMNLNPNGIFHIPIFVYFCEAFTGILFRKFFWLKPQPSADDPRLAGGVRIRCVRMSLASTYRTS
jgi:hypothetical protein